MMQIVFATTNAHKIEELRALFAAVPCTWSSLRDYPDMQLPDETGATFAANARLKAEAVTRATGEWALADDSGLCVDALDGAPGVHSARYAYTNVTLPPAPSHQGRGDTVAQRNIAKLLAALRDIPAGKRRAHFLCVMALAGPNSECHLAEGRCAGEIGFEPKGTSGFGYDPVFFVSALGKTMAELTAEEKNRISHRARAAEQMRNIISVRVPPRGIFPTSCASRA